VQPQAAAERTPRPYLRTGFHSRRTETETASSLHHRSARRYAFAARAAKVIGLNVAGVDILRSKHGPAVMEVNSSPGLEGIETATKKDIAGQIVEFIEKNAKPGKTGTKGKG
jgi:ribosomal protein S6--L-glutamate ligase